MSEFINNYSTRKESIKQALKEIHEGKPYEEVKSVFSEVLKNASAQEIAEIEQTLISEGLPVEDIQYLCDVHVAMFRESLDQQAPAEMQPGHPVYTFRAENELTALLLNEIKLSLKQFMDKPDDASRTALLEKVKKLTQYDAHYQRKENLLFPYLEKYGFSGPSSVMWGIHDDVRKGWKRMITVLSAKPADAKTSAREVDQIFSAMENAIREMFYKEDRILIPNALERLTEEDWFKIHEQELEFGFSFVQRGEKWPAGKENPPQQRVQLEQTPEKERITPMSDFPLSTGDLTLSQINLMLTHLPVDMTFVDEQDTVRYYSNTPERIFKRTPAIIGRKVEKCHPPASVNKVLEIVEDFKAGKRDHAEFWIQMAGKFIHIRYFAMRDQDGNYRGTLEVSQDITEVRKLEGEKRLLDG